MLIFHKGHTDTIHVYSVTVMTHVKALQAGHSSQGTSEPITPAPTEAADIRRDMGRMRPAGQGKKSQGRPGRGVGLDNNMAGGVAVALTPPVVVPEDVAFSVMPLVGDVGSVLPDVSPTVAAGAPLADCVDMQVLIDSMEVSPLAVAGRGGGVSLV